MMGLKLTKTELFNCNDETVTNDLATSRTITVNVTQNEINKLKSFNAEL